MDRQEEYDEYMSSPDWQVIRNQILERANHQCEQCGTTGELHVHHLHYENFKNELPEDLEALCPSCHVKADLHRERETSSNFEERQAEWAEELWEKRLDGWASAKYEFDWKAWRNADEVKREFILWLDSKGEDVPEEQRTRLFSDATLRPQMPSMPVGTKPVDAGAIWSNHLADYEHCRYMYFKRYIESPRQVFDFIPMHFAFSGFFREIVRNWLRNNHQQETRITDNAVSPEAVIVAFRERFIENNNIKKGYKSLGFDDREHYETKIYECVAHLNLGLKRWFNSELIIGVGESHEIVADGVRIQVFIDAITQSPGGNISAWLWSTAKSFGSVDKTTSDTLKLLLATEVIRRIHSKPVKIDAHLVTLTKAEHRVTESFDPDHVKWAIGKMISSYQAFRANSHYPTREPGKICNWCVWKPVCPAYPTNQR
jgi:hypothetical protein